LVIRSRRCVRIVGLRGGRSVSNFESEVRRSSSSRLAWLFGVEDVSELWACVVVGECGAGGCVVSVGAMTP
jgi:hypothetical protein